MYSQPKSTKSWSASVQKCDPTKAAASRPGQARLGLLSQQAKQVRSGLASWGHIGLTD